MGQSDFLTHLIEAQEASGKIIEVYEQAIAELLILQKGYELDPGLVEAQFFRVLSPDGIARAKAQIARLQSLVPSQLSNLLVVLVEINREIRLRLAEANPTVT